MTNNYYTKSAVPRLVSARALQINNNLDLLVSGFDKLPDPDRFKERNTNYIADTGAANAYAVTYPQPVPSAYAVGMTVDFVPANGNSGASTINVNSLGAKSILDYDGNALASGMIVAGRVHTIKYDGTAFRLAAIGTTVSPSAGSIDTSHLASGIYASQAQAEAGVENTLLMTALRTKQAIEALASSGWQLVSTTTPSGSVSELVYTGLDSYSDCAWIFADIRHADGTNANKIRGQASHDGGTTWSDGTFYMDGVDVNVSYYMNGIVTLYKPGNGGGLLHYHLLDTSYESTSTGPNAGEVGDAPDIVGATNSNRLVMGEIDEETNAMRFYWELGANYENSQGKVYFWGLPK